MVTLFKVVFLLTFAAFEYSRPVMVEPPMIEVEKNMAIEGGGAIELNAEDMKMLEKGEIPPRLLEQAREEKAPQKEGE